MSHVAGVNVTRHRTGRVSGSKAEPRQVLQPAASQARLRPRHPHLPHHHIHTGDRGWGWTPERLGGEERGGGV